MNMASFMVASRRDIIIIVGVSSRSEKPIQQPVAVDFCRYAPQATEPER